MLDFNTEPYFNDFSEDNKFYSILFRPSVAVQARELNQFQTILQNQISRHGSAIFKNGAVVIPGEFDIKPSIDYLTLSNIGTSITVSNLIGTTIINGVGVTAKVVHAVDATLADPATLYLSYISSSTSGAETKIFSNHDTLTSTDSLYVGMISSDVASSGFGSISTIRRGVYYVNGYFVLCDTQTVVLDKYSTNSSYKVGFIVSDSVKTSDDIGYDSLLDNSQGSSNYSAPGANRYYIDLTLTALPIFTDSPSFIELGRIKEEIIVSTTAITGYSQLEKTFARRTYNESGDYTVTPFQTDIREHRNNDRKSWVSSNTYLTGDIVSNIVSGTTYFYSAIHDMIAGAAVPVHTSGIVNYWEQTASPLYNRGIYSPDVVAPDTVGDASKFVVGFEPGKAYVQGYEIEKISTSYISIDKPRDQINDVVTDPLTSIPTTVGSFVEVTKVYKLPPILDGGEVGLYDSLVSTNGTLAGNKIGTCNVSGIQSESGTGENTYCKMFIYNIKLNEGKDFALNVKSFYSANFTANVSQDTYSLSLGTVSYAQGAINSLTGIGTTWYSDPDPSKRLIANDWVHFGAYSAQVVSTPTSDASLTISAVNTTGSSAGTNLVKIQTKVNEPNGAVLVFPLPHYATKTIDSQSYHIIQQATIGGITTTGSPPNNTLSISVSAGILLPDASNYYVQNGSGISIGANNFTVVATGSTAKLIFDTAVTGTYSVFCTVNKTSVSARKIKTLTSASQTYTQANAAATKLTLSDADCYKIVNIMMGDTDITSWYEFNNGQNDYFYDYGSISLIPSYPTPSSAITVNYQYFAHTAGDFCDLGSYTNIDYSLIPFYNGINLRNAIDFRPNKQSFNMYLPKRGYNMNANISYYLPRQDKLALDISGNFFNIEGSSSLNPGIPTDSSNGMTLNVLNIAPYVFNVLSDVEVSKVENKRYTMRDIGKLETRINNLEYYTSLSLLEQETSSLSILDDQGNERFKNGFIVDNFTGHNIGDTASPDYLCSIDMVANELRPFASMDNINLIVDTNSSSNYKMYGDLVTLPLDPSTPHVVLAQNTYASRTENINPFAVFTFLGNVNINPSSDDWFEVNRLPDIITNVEGNYTIMTQMAASSGVLGTVWNSWQTQWTGTPLVTNTYSGAYATQAKNLGLTGQKFSVSAGLNTSIHGWDLKAGSYSLETTTATQIGQSRSGINTVAVAKIDTQLVDDKVLSIAVIPYIRSRYVLIQAKGLKPNTIFYPYFDNLNISSHCSVANVITYTPVSGVFDSQTNSGINAALDSVRTISGDTQVCLNIGDVIVGGVSGNKAVVVGKERILSSAGVATYILYTINKSELSSGAFIVGETLTGSISNAVGTFVSTSVPTDFKTGSTGDLNMLFKIPNTDAMRFRTGTRELKLIDNSNANGAFESKGVSSYTASGTIQTKQSNISATRNVEFVQSQVSDNQTITNTTSKVVSGTAWYDPLAQTFLVDCSGGAFLSKIDLFFASKDSNIPVSIEIREVVNGFPTAVILPFSKVVVKSEDVNLSSNLVKTWDDVSYPKYDTPTTITFPSPVYVKDKTEYAIVLVSDSDSYKVWISQMGDLIPGGEGSISKQPYLGVLLKSQNASTWTASQDQDLKFTLYRANFNKNVIGNLVLTNDNLPKVTLVNDPIQTLLGSSTVRVWHNNHGFNSNDQVTLTGSSSTDATITSAVLNNTFTVLNPKLDSYTIVVSAVATKTGYIGGSSLKATRSVVYETLQPNITELNFSETNINYSIVTTESSNSTSNAELSCITNDNNYFYTPKVVKSGRNANLQMKAKLKTSNSALSPIIDTHSCSAVAVRNKIDSPTEANTNIPLIDNVTILSSVSCTLSGNTLTTGVDANRIILTRCIVGSYITFTGASTNSASNGIKFLITGVDYSSSASKGTLTLSNANFTAETVNLTVSYYNSFFDEITPMSSSSTSKYVSKAITLSNPSNSLRVRYAVCCPTEADVFVYYKIGTNPSDFQSTIWVLMNPDSTMPKTAIGSNNFTDIDYTGSNLANFSVVSVKLVMRSTNTASIPRVKDLRIIACVS